MKAAFLAHLDISRNDIGSVAEESLRTSWRGQASGLVLEDEEEDEEDEVEEEVEDDEDEDEDGADKLLIDLLVSK